MLYRQLVNQQAAPPKILNSGTKSPLAKAFGQLAPFLDQTNTIHIHITNTIFLESLLDPLNIMAKALSGLCQHSTHLPFISPRDVAGYIWFEHNHVLTGNPKCSGTSLVMCQCVFLTI